MLWLCKCAGCPPQQAGVLYTVHLYSIVSSAGTTLAMCQVGMLGMDEECLRSIQESKTLAGIFQSVVDDCKVGLEI